MANTEPQLALADIQEPVLNTFWPPAPGWWLLAVLLILLLAYSFRFFWKKWQKALPLRQAKAELHGRHPLRTARLHSTNPRAVTAVRCSRAQQSVSYPRGRFSLRPSRG